MHRIFAIVCVVVALLATTDASAQDVQHVHRFYSAERNLHFFTATEAERRFVLLGVPDFAYEGIPFSAPTEQGEGLVPVYRLRNLVTGGYFFTASEAEKDVVADLEGWNLEGVAFHARLEAAEGWLPCFRFYNSASGTHFFTTSLAESEAAGIIPGFIDEGVAFYVLPGVESPPGLQGSHAGRLAGIDETAPSTVCLNCHVEEARQMHASVHYQWKGPTPEVPGIEGEAGKLGGINDFCGYPDISWIGLLQNVDGDTVSGGCSNCHSGLGDKPTAEDTWEQLANIDCLDCHADAYERMVVDTGEGLSWVPDVEAMTVSVAQAAADPAYSPSRAACLRCHGYSGGGPNAKRGDLEPALAEPAPDFDVHMGGQDMLCTDCHVASGHRIPGRGIDLRPNDRPEFEVDCRNCHGASPHPDDDDRLDQHARIIHCAGCHVPAYARSQATDMDRDFSGTPIIGPNRLWEAEIDHQMNVAPVLVWNNDLAVFNTFGEPLVPGDDGLAIQAAPLGDITDPAARLHPAKIHLATVPVDPVSRAQLPISMGSFFQFGDVAEAIRLGTEAAGLVYAGHDWQRTRRTMGIYHGVQDEHGALSCADCHGSGRVDFAALGYTPRNPDLSTCSSGCHGDESDDWSFEGGHEEHVDDRNYDCSRCHFFSRD